MSAPRVHELKSWPQYFAATLHGIKSFDVRLNDREYHDGDLLHLFEFDPVRREYTGRCKIVRVVYVMPLEPLGIAPGYVVLGLDGARV